MSIFNFIKGMLPRLQKADIEEDIRITIKEMGQVAIPQYFAAATAFKVNKIQSDEVKLFEKAFYKHMDLKTKGPNFLTDIHGALERALTNMIYIQKVTTDVLEADLLNEGLTAKKAHLVRAAASISFVSNFSIEFLNHILVLESNAVGDSREIPPAEAKYIDSRYEMFFKNLNEYGMAPDKFQNLMVEVPDVVISTKNAASIAQVFKPTQLDPFGSMGLSGFTGNPIYHVRLLVTEWQGKRYNANKDKKKLLELRLLHLKSLNDNSPNPRLEQEINYIENRVSKLDRALREVEDSIPGETR